MRRKTLSYLEDFIIKGLYDGFVSKPFITLFKNYMDKEYKNINDFLYVADAYVRFVMQNKNYLLEEFPDLKEEELRSDMSEILTVLNQFRKPEHYVVMRNYVKMVEYFINKKTRVLDVGAGGYPYSSIKLAKHNKNISAMDKFILSDELIGKLKVNPINGYFKLGEDLYDYDMVVGLKPCSAIGNIVETCKKNNKPYFIHLCNCNAADYSLSKLGMLAGDWRYILPEIDPDVKFVNVFATNIDMSKEKLNKIVYKKCRMTREMQQCGMLSFMESFNGSINALALDNSEEKTIYTPQGEIVVSKADTNGAWFKAEDEKEYGIE